MSELKKKLLQKADDNCLENYHVFKFMEALIEEVVSLREALNIAKLALEIDPTSHPSELALATETIEASNARLMPLIEMLAEQKEKLSAALGPAARAAFEIFAVDRPTQSEINKLSEDATDAINQNASAIAKLGVI